MTDYKEIVGMNKTVTVVKSHQETQDSRITTSKNASWQSQTWSLTCATGNFMVNAATWICQTISFQVANAWSVVTNKWQETARAVGGAVVTLIRGGHH